MKQVLRLPVWVELGVIALKGNNTLSSAPELKSHDKCYLQETPFLVGGRP